jgi:hypothetical protein
LADHAECPFVAGQRHMKPLIFAGRAASKGVRVRPVRDPSAQSSRWSWSTLGGSPFPPIEDYAFISDCEVCGSIAPSGNVEWMCLPRMDGPSVFGAILDRDGRLVPPGPGGCSGTRRAAVPSGHHGGGDLLGHPDGMGGGPGRTADRAVASSVEPIQHPSASTRRSPCRTGAASHRSLFERLH